MTYPILGRKEYRSDISKIDTVHSCEDMSDKKLLGDYVKEVTMMYEMNESLIA